MSQLDALGAGLRRALGGRRALVVCDVVQGADGIARSLAEHGVDDAVLVAGRVGTGALPKRPYHTLGLPTAGLLESIRGTEAALADLPPEVRDAIDAWDPDRSASTFGPFFFSGRAVAGRPCFGGRPPNWRALEDKIAILPRWEAAGLPTAPSRVVPVEVEALRAAHGALDVGAGTVWAADNREGFHGGAEGTRWVRTAADLDGALAFMATCADAVRVQPFLDGIPCSIHGLVFPEEVVVLRPVEMVVLRRADRGGFRYMRAATTWDPAPADREAMRAHARAFGAYLRRAVGYRGAFTLDGVMTVDGFRPTECNPRVGAALEVMAPAVPWTLLAAALIEGDPLPEVDPAAFEAEVLARADAERPASMGTLLPIAVAETERRRLAWDGAAWRVCAGEGCGDATVAVGPGPTGGYLNLSVDPSSLPRGPSVGPMAAALVAWANAELGAGLGRCTAAPDVRRERLATVEVPPVGPP